MVGATTFLRAQMGQLFGIALCGGSEIVIRQQFLISILNTPILGCSCHCMSYDAFMKNSSYKKKKVIKTRTQTGSMEG